MHYRELGAFDSMGEAHLLERPDEIPADIHLPPFHPETRGISETMMIAVPVFAPGGELQRSEPPQVLGGLAVLVEFTHMRDTVDEALKVQRVHQPNRTNPEERLPSECQRAEDGEKDQHRFRTIPEVVFGFVEIRRPAVHIRGLRLIEPSQVCPPESAVR